MTRFTRRDTIKIGAGALAGTALFGAGSLRAAMPVADVTPPDLPIEDGASLASAPAVEVRPGRRDACSSRTPRNSPRRPASTSRSTSRAGRICARRSPAVRPMSVSGPDIVYGLVRRSAQIRRQGARSDRLAELSRQEVRRLVSAGREIRHQGRTLDRHAAGRFGRPHGVPQVAACKRPASRSRRPTSRASSIERQAAREWARPAASRSAMRSATATPGATGWSGRMAATGRRERQGRHQQPGDDRGAGIRQGDSTRPSSRARCPGSIRQQQGVSRRRARADPERHLDLLRREELRRSRRCRRWPRTSITRRCRSVRSAGRPSARWSSTSMIFNYTPYPNAAKAYLQLHDGGGAVRPLSDRLHRLLEPSAGSLRRMRRLDGRSEARRATRRDRGLRFGTATRAASARRRAAVLSEFVVVQMVASVCAGEATPEEAAAEAERRTQRYFR